MVNNNLLRRTGIAIASLLFSGGLIAGGAATVRAQNQQNQNQQSQNSNNPQQQPQPQWGDRLTDVESNSQTVISVEEVSEEAHKLAGSTVTISGRVERIIAPNVFILQETGSIYNDDRVLVVLASQQPVQIFENGRVQVTGEVRQLIAAEFDADYDLTWDLELERKLEVEYTGASTVVASFVRLLPANKP
jgi:hypothetical protein